MTVRPDLLCIEDTSHGVSRWFRIVQMHQHLYVIESTAYASVDHSYVMQFDNQAEFDRWIDQQKLDGWEITYADDHNFSPADLNMIEQLKTNIFRWLQAKSIV